jgi:iron complex outermembrane receptor protein
VKKVLVGLMLAACLSNYNATPAQADISGDLGTVIISASRIAQQNYKVAGNVTVINQDEIEASNATNLPELLNKSLGVHIYDYGTTKSATVDIRGFGETAASNVLVLVNDRKLNSVDLSGPDLSRIPIGSVERIEIIRGAGSVLYGDNAVGGVVNIITKEGTGPLKGRVGGLYGSYDAQGTDLEVSGEKNKVSYYLYSKYMDDRGYRDNSDVLSKDYDARVGYNLWDKVGVDLNLTWHDDEFGLPGALSDFDLQTLGRRGSSTPSDYSKTKDRAVNFSFNLDPWPDDMYLGKLIVDFTYRNRDVFDNFVSFGVDTKRNIDQTGVSAKYIFDQTIFDKQVNFVTGVDFNNIDNDILGGQFNTANIDISKDEFGVYGSLEYELFDHFFINGGTRYDQAKYIFDDHALHAYNTSEPSESVSMAGVKYEYGKGSAVHANVQQIFRFLATDEWYVSSTGALNLNLKQQTGLQYEVGLRHNFNDKFVAYITPYLVDLNDEIFFDPKNFQNSNIDKTRRIGVEVGQETDLEKWIPFEIGFLDKLNFVTNYNYQDPEIMKGTFKGSDIPFVARHQASVGLSTTVLEHYNVSFMERYVGARYAISDFENKSTQIKPYYTLDSKVAYNAKNFEIYAGVNNIFNKLYTETIVFVDGFGNFSYPSPGRNYKMGVNVKF